MKKLLFIMMMLLVGSFAFSQAATANDDDADIKALLQKNDDFFNDFETKFKNLKAYDSSKASRDTLKQMQDMLDRQKKLIEFKMEEIRVMESGGKSIPVAEFSRLNEMISRYKQMSVELSDWVNKKK